MIDGTSYRSTCMTRRNRYTREVHVVRGCKKAIRRGDEKVITRYRVQEGLKQIGIIHGPIVVQSNDQWATIDRIATRRHYYLCTI